MRFGMLLTSKRLNLATSKLAMALSFEKIATILIAKVKEGKKSKKFCTLYILLYCDSDLIV